MTVATSPCAGCDAQLAPGLLACPGCHRLIHRDTLVGLAQQADTAERAGELSEALASLRQALQLLPAGTVQHTSIRQRMEKLSAAIDGRVPPAQAAQKGPRFGAGKLAGLSAAGLLLLKSKSLLALLLSNLKLLLIGLTKLPTLLSMLVYARWSEMSGLGFGAGLIASVYVHEVGHVAALRRYGIAASAPMFVPGLGAFVRLKQYPTSAHEEARTGLAGPVWGLAAALVSLAVGMTLDSPTARTVASVGATLNLFNMIPVWQLDGARGLRALSKGQRLVVGVGSLLVAACARQWMPAAVGSIALIRAFSEASHPQGDRAVYGTFMGLVCGHTAVAYFAG